MRIHKEGLTWIRISIWLGKPKPSVSDTLRKEIKGYVKTRGGYWRMVADWDIEKLYEITNEQQLEISRLKLKTERLERIVAVLVCNTVVSKELLDKEMDKWIDME